MISPKRKHHLVALGGSFDHFHAGHEHFLKFAKRQGEELLIGVTSDDLIASKPFAASLEPYSVRAASVRRFCQKKQIRAQLIELRNLYGPTLENKKIGALVVTEETQAGADKINQVRAAMKLRPLPIYVADFLLDEANNPLHSASIRAGRANRQGRVYGLHFQTDLVLNKEQRQALSAPLGKLIESLDSFEPAPGAILVGDQTTTFFHDNNLNFELAIIDGLIKREPTHNSGLIESFSTQTQTANNKAGLISKDLISVLQNRTSATKLILIEGEEDLATAAVILLFPLGTTIYYGQPDAGLVEVKITEKLKEEIFAILKPDETTR